MATKQRGDAVLITLGRSGLALARHDFPRAHRLAEEVLTARPDSIEGLINRTDADVELGRYGEATADVETLLDRSPGVAALARLSYVRQLNGDLPGALVAMRQAVSAAGGGGVDRAVARTYLGDILLEKGDLPGARRAYDLALTDDARLPIAIIGQARTLAATGGTAKAVSLLQALTARFPTPGALILLADRQRADGDAKAAADTDQIVRATEKLFEANGADVDVEMAVFEADRGNAARAFMLATKAYRTRKTIFTADAMAWALLKAGRATDAVPFAEQAVKSDPAVASVDYHAAAVFAATGATSRAADAIRRASRNPWFSSSQADAAAQLARQLHVSWPTRS